MVNKDRDGRGIERTATGRIGRPRRLTTDAIVKSAIHFADEHGLEALSMPKLARRLGVGTMTLYGYVDNKKELLDQIAIQMFEELSVSDQGDWRRDLFTFFSDFRGAAITHPTLAGLLATGRVTIPAVFDILESFFKKMTDGGVSAAEAVRIFYAGLTYTIGFVLWEIPRTRRQDGIDYDDLWESVIGQLDPIEFPILNGPAKETALTVASKPQFDWGLSRIING